MLGAVEGYTSRNVSANAATSVGDNNGTASSGDNNAAASTGDKSFGRVLSPDIGLEIDDRYGRSSVVVGGFAIVAGIEDACNKSSPSSTRLLGVITEGDSTE